MNLELEGRVALVAGSSRGIGKAVARSFLAEGARTAVTGRDAAAVTATTAELEREFGHDRVFAHAGDLSKPETVRALDEELSRRWGRLDCVVANVGSGRSVPGWSVPDDEWQRVFAVNLWAGVNVVQQTLPRLLAAGRGSVVLISSIAGVESMGAPIAYSAAKAALINYAKNLARMLAPKGVRVNCVAPGNVLFPGGSWEKHLQERREAVESFIKAEVPLGRFADPREIADVVVFLASERASFVTGSCVVVDAGQTRSAT